MELKNELLTYQEIKDGYELVNDPDEIGSYTLLPGIVKTFMENPSLEDLSKCMIMFCRVDGKVAARSLFFPSRVKIGNSIITAQGGSSLYANPEYRHSAIGLDIMRYPIENKEYPLLVYSGITKMALPMYKALRFNVFSFPEFWQPRRSEFAFRSKGLKGLPLTIVSACADSLIFMINAYKRVLIRRKYCEYKVNRLKEIPIWAEDIVKKDNHKYAEIHDRAWMTWTLNNNFFGKENEEQGFYEILKNGRPIGFFMTKIRNLSLPEHDIKSVIFGNVYEWGTLDENILTEYDIYRMASLTFPKYVDIYDVATADARIAKKLKKLFMFRHGDAYIVVKDLTKQYPDSCDITNWRIRYGYADVPFY